MKYIFLLLLLFSNIAISDNRTSPLGINLMPVVYYQPSRPFMDIMKQGSSWYTQTNSVFDTGEQANIPLDSDGWPTKLDGTGANGNPVTYTKLSVLLLRNYPSPYYSSGQYVVLYDGQGSLAVAFDGTQVSSVPGRFVFNVATPSSSGVQLSITASTTGNPIRNIRVVKASNEEAFKNGEIFNPEYISYLSPYKTIRFMDWQATNGSTQVSWKNRSVPSYYNWTISTKGVPFEIMAKLANRLNADAWINIPHSANNDYIANMALISKKLFKNRVYIEYSNEVWNAQFTQYSYAVTQGKLTWKGKTASDYDFNRSYYGMRTAKMCDVWKLYWFDQPSRLTCVFASQTVNSYATTQSLACPMWDRAPCSTNHGIEVLAIAPYINSVSSDLITDVNDVFTRINASDGWLKSATDGITLQKGLADANGLKLIAYEGGQHLAKPGDTPTSNIFISAQTDSRMGTAYNDLLNYWKNAGGQLFNHYADMNTYNTSGSWGLTQNYESSIKRTTVEDFITNNTCWWSNCGN